jgi:hypothetical protein
MRAILLLVALLLLGLVAAELRPDAPDAVVAGLDGAGTIVPSLPADDRAARIAALIARPLFSLPQAPRQVVPAARVAPPSVVEPGPPRLTGTLVGTFGRRAIFAPADGGRPLVVPEGGQAGPFRVDRIAPGEVEVTGPAGPATLRPAFTPGSAPAAQRNTP